MGCRPEDLRSYENTSEPAPPAKATSDPSNQIGQADLQPRPATVSFVTTEHVTQALSQVQGGHRHKELSLACAAIDGL